MLNQNLSQRIREHSLASGVNPINSDTHGMLDLERHEAPGELIEHLLARQ
jgi:hypothetical protein